MPVGKVDAVISSQPVLDFVVLAHQLANELHIVVNSLDSALGIALILLFLFEFVEKQHLL